MWHMASIISVSCGYLIFISNYSMHLQRQQEMELQMDSAQNNHTEKPSHTLFNQPSHT